MPRSRSAPRSRKVSSTELPTSPAPSKPKGTRKTPSRRCKTDVTYEEKNASARPRSRARSRIPTPIVEKPDSPVPSGRDTPIAAKPALSTHSMTAPVPAAGFFQQLNSSSRMNESLALGNAPEIGLIQDQSGFSGDEETELSLLNMDNKAVGIGDFKLNASPGKKFTFNPPTDLKPPTSSRETFKFDVNLSSPSMPIVDTPTVKSLLALQHEAKQSKPLDEPVQAPKKDPTPDTITVGRQATPSSTARLLKQIRSTLDTSRPAYKNRLSTFLRNRIAFKKGETEIRTTEDAGLAQEGVNGDKPVALHFKQTNQLYVNVPLKARLLGAADTLGMGFLSAFLHTLIFMVSFWLCNLLYTYWFPATEDERVNYFYEMLTRQKVGSFYVHVRHFERWMVRPRFTPEFLAILCTIAASTSIAGILSRSEDHNSARKIKLVKLC